MGGVRVRAVRGQGAGLHERVSFALTAPAHDDETYRRQANVMSHAAPNATDESRPIEEYNAMLRTIARNRQASGAEVTVDTRHWCVTLARWEVRRKAAQCAYGFRVFTELAACCY